MNIYVHLWQYLAHFLECAVFLTEVAENIETRVLCSITFFPTIVQLWNNVENYGTVGQATDDNTTWYMRFACWISKATNTHSEYVTLIAWQRQQRFCERVSVLHSTYIARVWVRLIIEWGLLLPTVSNVISFVFLERMKSGFGTENNVGCTDFVIVLRFWKAFLSKTCSELLCHGLLQVGTVTSNLKRVCRILCIFQLLWQAYLPRGLSRWFSRTVNRRYPNFVHCSFNDWSFTEALFTCTKTTKYITGKTSATLHCNNSYWFVMLKM